jgi:protoporphyrinogen oxidase
MEDFLDFSNTSDSSRSLTHPNHDRSVADVLKERFGAEVPQDVFEFIMSYRWGQDYGCDADKISA